MHSVICVFGICGFSGESCETTLDSSTCNCWHNWIRVSFFFRPSAFLPVIYFNFLVYVIIYFITWPGIILRVSDLPLVPGNLTEQRRGAEVPNQVGCSQRSHSSQQEG